MAVVRWSKPPLGWLKLNVDASFVSATTPIGIGAICRDSDGSCLGGFQHSDSSVGSAKHAELVALFLGLQFAIQHHFSPLILETDCFELVQAVSGTSMDHSEFGFLISDLRELLLESNSRLIHVKEVPTLLHIL